jgi:hypothetical protein
MDNHSTPITLHQGNPPTNEIFFKGEWYDSYSQKLANVKG